jgi:hypothetical protein
MAKYYSILFMLMLCGAAAASNFGSVEKNNFLTVERGQPARFTLLFWTTDNETQKLLVRPVLEPENMNVIFQDTLYISRDTGKEMIYIAGNYMLATPLDVVIMPHEAEPGIYSVLLSATMQKSGEEINFQQERLFNLTFTIKGETVKTNNPSAGMMNANVPVAGGETTQLPDNSIYILFAAIIIIISVLVYIYV